MAGPAVVAKTTPDVPRERATTPGATAPTPTALADWSPPPATTGVPGRSPVASAAVAGDGSGDRGAFEGGWQQGRGDVERRENLGRPGSGGEVEQDRAGTVGDVDREIIGEPVADVVLGQEDVADPGPVVGFVSLHPQQLGGREPGEGIVAGDLDQAIGSDPTPDLGALVLGALIVPQDRGPHHFASTVEKDRTVHLAGETDRLDVRPGDAQIRQDLADRRRRSRPTRAGDLARSRADAESRSRRTTKRRRVPRLLDRSAMALVAVVEESIPMT